MDFDHDGWEDLFVINGHVPTIDVAANHVFDPDKLYRNNGDGTFEDVSEAAGIADTGIGRGSALCDYDQDGDLDLAVVNIKTRPPAKPKACGSTTTKTVAAVGLALHWKALRPTWMQ